MFFDVIFGIFVFAVVGFGGYSAASEDPFPQQTAPPLSPFDAPEMSDAPSAGDFAEVAPSMPAAPAPGDVQQMILQQLSCTGPLDPTSVITALMQEDMVRPDERITYESISCFPIHGPSAIAGMPFDIVCASTTDAEATQMPTIYAPDPSFPGYPMLSIGTTATDMDGLRSWATDQFGPARAAEAVIDGLYTPENIPVEVYCAAFGGTD